ncbi:MAG: SEC-C domain-containing protein [Proteobacteria bacterium]|jgi:hypothetical protein|nr:SEC-C domain-containing protein [Pseudomonadota bacterium]
MAADIGRNDPCPCGSGRRYKHCHGSVGAAAMPFPMEASPGRGGAQRDPRASAPGPRLLEAFAAHRAGMLARAEALYRQALDECPGDVEGLHMLGMLEFERGHCREALELVADASERAGWDDPVIRENLGLVLAKLLGPRANARQQTLVERYLERERARKAAPVAAGQVSVVLLALGSADAIARSIGSIAAQCTADIELVVAGGARADAERALGGWRGASAAVVVDAEGLVEAAHRGTARASGAWVAFIEAGDRYAPARIERMKAEIARAEPLWGFSRIGNARDAAGSGDAALRPGDHRGDEPASFALLRRDLVHTVGNLFVERTLFLGLGGLRDVDDPADEFARRASRVVEPVPMAERLYFRDRVSDARRPEGASRRESSGAGFDGSADVRVAEALREDRAATNPFCPGYPANRELLLRDELRAGRGGRIPVEILRAAAAEWRAKPASAPYGGAPRVASIADASGASNASDAASASGEEKVALVVLGVYRSGTSAIARALNLCGAALPERIIAPRLGINPKGFWEAEAVTDLDARLMRHLGADWNSLDVVLPRDGPLVDEFLGQMCELLAREYGGAKLILVKDPRISMLAPLWHRALVASRYRPAYLVAVRHPLEVARSFEGQGDMQVDSGLALWRAYMQRVEAFVAGAGARVAWLRYTALLDDWHSALERVASRLEVALDTRSRASEVDAFLERGLHNYRVEDRSPGDDAPGSAAAADGVLDLYRRLVARCDADARLPPTH